MGVNLLRRWHLRQAEGNVLEVGMYEPFNFIKKNFLFIGTLF